MEKQYEHPLRGGQAMAVELPPGMRIRIIDTAGGQIGAMMAFADADLGRGFSMAVSFTLSTLKRKPDGDLSKGLIEGDAVANLAGEELMCVIADTMPVKGIRNIHTRICNAAAYRVVGDAKDVGCFGALLEALAPWDADDPLERPADVFDALDLFGKPQDISLDGLDLPDGFTDDGNWEELGVPMGRAGDYLEFEILAPCLVACSNCISSGDAVIRVEFFA
ncbi:MAG: DUF1989 domain-containing protein [Alphaproteobacteria bacterium]